MSVISLDEFLNNSPFPRFIQFETSTVCNAKCLMCPHDKMKRSGTAKWSTITKIIREVGYRVDAICPFLMQEPMLEPRLASILANIKQYNSAITTMIYSNLSILHKDIEKIIKLGLLDTLEISFYGPTEQLYKKWQPPLNRDKTIANIKRVKALRDRLKRTKPKIEIHVLSIPEIMDNVWGYKEVAAYVDKITNVQFDTFHGDIPDLAGDQTQYLGKPQPRTPCARLWTGVNIHFDGSVVPCCIDYNDEHVMGNVNDNTLDEIWNGKKFKRFRKLHIARKWDKIKMCKNCTVHEYQFGNEWITFWENVKEAPLCE